MSEETDYYELLEVSRDASGDEIKKSFRRLAMKYHPDRNPGNKEAEQKFKQINEAYEVLKDEQKRAAYDRYGKQAFAGGMGGTGGNPFGGFEFNFGAGGFSDIFSEVFSDFMGGGRNRQAAYAQDGADVRYNMEITLEEAFHGVEKEITIPSTETCEKCHGHGTKDGKEAPRKARPFGTAGCRRRSADRRRRRIEKHRSRTAGLRQQLHCRRSHAGKAKFFIKGCGVPLGMEHDFRVRIVFLRDAADEFAADPAMLHVGMHQKIVNV